MLARDRMQLWQRGLVQRRGMLTRAGEHWHWRCAVEAAAETEMMISAGGRVAVVVSVTVGRSMTMGEKEWHLS